MSDILNPLGGRVAGSTNAPIATSVLATVADPPHGFRQIDPGTIIKGIVIGREGDGLTSIATDKGTVRVAANAILQPGTHVTLEVRPTGDQLQVLILANEHSRSTQELITANNQGNINESATPIPTPTASLQRNVPSIEYVGTTNRGVVIQTSSSTATNNTTSLSSSPTITNSAMTQSSLAQAAGAQGSLLAATTEKKDKITNIGISPKTPTNLNNQTNDLASSFQKQQPLNNAAPLHSTLNNEAKNSILALFTEISSESKLAATLSVGSKMQPLPIGTELSLRVLAVRTETDKKFNLDSFIQSSIARKNNIVIGSVINLTPLGHAVISTPIGNIMLQDPSSLSPGTQIALVIDNPEIGSIPSDVTPIVQTPQQALLKLSQGWPTFADIVAFLQKFSVDTSHTSIDLEIARQALAILPHFGNRLAVGIINAMAALRSGDLTKLLGTSLIKSFGSSTERDELIKRLKGEFLQLSALAQDRAEVDWRALFLPVIDDQGVVTQINFFYRQPKKNNMTYLSRDMGTRFVVEANFSHLGPFQLDGLMREQRFDLMIRSRHHLSDHMKREIEAIYEETRGISGFSGSIAFQTVNDFPVVPLEDLKESTKGYMT